MVRAPCCEKMGLNKGPWSTEEDQILIHYIQNHGHSNWRALPKQAGLLRCGKSCRLRWINYLKPDIKRGNLTREEEETIITLHQMLGNRWSSIAAKLPGRTDNEIKNVWHTHLKKRLKQTQHNSSSISETKSADVTMNNISISKIESSSTSNNFPEKSEQSSTSGCSTSISEPQSSKSNEFSSISFFSEETNNNTGDNNIETSSENYFPEIDESFWSEETSLAENYSSNQFEFSENPIESNPLFPFNSMELMSYDDYNIIDDNMDFWFDIFIKAGGTPELPEQLY